MSEKHIQPGKTSYYLDFLYGQYFNQVIRCKVSPVYVENKILDEITQIIRNYLLQFVNELKKKVDEEKKKIDNSYLVYDRKYYKDIFEKYEIDIKEFKEKLNQVKPKEFLKEDFSKVSADLEKMFPKHLPQSKVKENLSKELEELCE
jgi:uncharacterized protein YllA (UPF0747 family)